MGVLWLYTSIEECKLLIGVSANSDILKVVIYNLMTHHTAIRAVDIVRANHAGPRLTVEMDVVIDPHENLRKCHDICVDLQNKLQNLLNVDRAFVHIDYETTHRPEHAKMIYNHLAAERTNS